MRDAIRQLSAATAVSRVSLLDRLWHGFVHPIGTDWTAWENAHTLADLGRVTADWLEGRVQEHPNGYDVPDAETTELVPVLAAANRAGFITDGSQPGEPPSIGYDGATWQQRAAVTGFCTADTFFALADLAHVAGLLVRVRVMPPRRRLRLPFGQLRREPGIPITLRAGSLVTDFGTPMLWGDIILGFWVCPDDVLEQLAEAWQVTIVDPVWGRNDRLWDVLWQFTATR